jgi:hypothetical protein
MRGVPPPSVLGGRRNLPAVLAVLALSVGVAVLALVTARGVTYLGGNSYRTEFISAWWWLVWLLVPVPVGTVRRRPTAAAGQTVALVLPQFVAAAVCVARYRSSGWADGLEVLAFLHPALLTVVTCALVSRRRRGRPRA